MPRCSSTNKFAGYDEPEVEVEESDIQDATFSATVRCVRPCAECGEEMAEYTFSLETSVSCPTCDSECGGHYGEERTLPDRALPSDPLPEDHPDYELKAPEFELVDGDEPDIDGSGGGRYKKNIFTCSLTGHAKCLCCGDEIEFEVEDSAAASEFEVLV